MKISSVRLINFRNFRDATIHLNKSTLIIGANDIGKTNFLYALRILLDKTLSEADIEPRYSDFFAYADEVATQLSITLCLDELTDNVRSTFREHVNDDGQLYLHYEATLNPETGQLAYCIKVGSSEAHLEELRGRYYLRRLNLRYVNSNRSLKSFIKKEKVALLREAKERREEWEIESDTRLEGEVKDQLEEVNDRMQQMNYVARATEGLNEELGKLSFHHEQHKVVFEVASTDPGTLVNGARLASEINDLRIEVGGDGRNNQIFLSLWASRNRMEQNEGVVESVICAIEEPEAHLHPHQQRRLAQYLSNNLNTQVILTSHSPQIATKFAPGSIVRFRSCMRSTTAAGEGCTHIVESEFVNFGHRLDAIAAEVFFADVVFLVEGQSEVLFYKALARQLDLELDRYNISILMVDGVGFATYINLLKVLEIPFVVRTDNDVFKVPRTDPARYRLAGLQRGIKILNDWQGVDLRDSNVNHPDLAAHIPEFAQQEVEEIHQMPPHIQAAVESCISVLAEHNIFISEGDLEKDILATDLRTELEAYLESHDDEDLTLQRMQRQKATFMYHFLRHHESALSRLADSTLAFPLRRCIDLAKRTPQTADNDEADA